MQVKRRECPITFPALTRKRVLQIFVENLFVQLWNVIDGLFSFLLHFTPVYEIIDLKLQLNAIYSKSYPNRSAHFQS